MHQLRPTSKPYSRASACCAAAKFTDRSPARSVSRCFLGLLTEFLERRTLRERRRGGTDMAISFGIARVRSRAERRSQIGRKLRRWAQPSRGRVRPVTRPEYTTIRQHSKNGRVGRAGLLVGQSPESPLIDLSCAIIYVEMRPKREPRFEPSANVVPGLSLAHVRSRAARSRGSRSGQKATWYVTASTPRSAECAPRGGPVRRTRGKQRRPG